jgi:hypothetical protein
MRRAGPIAWILTLLLTAPGCGGGSPANNDSKRVFVSSLQKHADFGGLVEGDAVCATAAGAANLPGTWKAWLSDSKTDAVDRIADVGPWFLMDRKTKVFNNKTNLKTTPIVGIDQDEQGTQVTHFDCVWTGTVPGGTRGPGDTCMDWTATGSQYSAAAKVGSTGADWTQDQINPFPCTSTCHLYCFEQ